MTNSSKHHPFSVLTETHCDAEKTSHRPSAHSRLLWAPALLVAVAVDALSGGAKPPTKAFKKPN